MSTLDRWRLVLGKYADQQLGAGGGLQGAPARMDRALEYLYGREYRGRGLRGQDGQPGPGSLDASQLTLVTWLGEVRELFPNETAEIIEKHALERYGMTELITDPQTLEKLEPNQQLLRSLLMLRGHLKGEVLKLARQIVRQVVEEIKRKLEAEVRRTLAGRLNRQRHSPMSMLQNFDARGTVRRNLEHYDRERQQIVIEQLRFFERNMRRLPWHIILCVDQSGSMADSVIHSAVMAGILAGLPVFRVKIVVFDTSIVDLSEYADDPVEMLMRVQLGGGTDIAQAIRYCAQLVENPHRTVLVLVSDFCEGGQPGELLRVVKSLAGARVRLLGLASLDDQAQPHYDRRMAEQLAESGMEIAALTPQRLAQWLVEVIS
jgi:Mg-chelatase subunit ChlD